LVVAPLSADAGWSFGELRQNRGGGMVSSYWQEITDTHLSGRPFCVRFG
jgi:hypothetical protein